MHRNMKRVLLLALLLVVFFQVGNHYSRQNSLPISRKSDTNTDVRTNFAHSHSNRSSIPPGTETTACSGDDSFMKIKTNISLNGTITVKYRELKNYIFFKNINDIPRCGKEKQSPNQGNYYFCTEDTSTFIIHIVNASQNAHAGTYRLEWGTVTGNSVKHVLKVVDCQTIKPTQGLNSTDSEKPKVGQTVNKVLITAVVLISVVTIAGPVIYLKIRFRKKCCQRSASPHSELSLSPRETQRR
ncbi:uncharacterized protein LOC122809200 isoform X2 [Protopterus annectens]|uniref:uncharacterized protein LOC122809200 isoform X2 n=1 Tax=Protopterus annectens TaxID=7888 RepID=UPI001CFC32E6|nr:uncharacterized protein LOC122809200 isoform X2 [Protopterus annectens]